RASGWTRAGNFVGNGPFVLTEWRPNERIVVEKNERYWDAAAVALRGIEFFPYQDRQMSHRAFMAGQIHKTDNIPIQMRDGLRGGQSEVFFEDAYFATNFIGLNVRHEWLSDSRVRQALHMVLDVPRILESVTK